MKHVTSLLTLVYWIAFILVPITVWAKHLTLGMATYLLVYILVGRSLTHKI